MAINKQTLKGMRTVEVVFEQRNEGWVRYWLDKVGGRRIGIPEKE